MNKNSVRLAMIALAYLSVLKPPLVAQSSFGSIVGTITDSTGAIMPGAAVTLTNLGTSERRTAESDGSGNFQFVSLLPGEYRVDMEKAGFKHLTRDRVEVAVSSTARVDASMQVGQVGETVEVSGQAELLHTEDASVGQVVEGRAVLETPLNGRNVMNLIQLAPGVIPHGQSQGQNARSGFTNYQIAGGQVGQGKTVLDGVNIMTGLFNGQAFVPIQDTIQEFQVMANNLPPEFGGTLNGIINLATKSGTNEFHGTGYEFLRNRVLNASTFFSNQAGIGKPAFTQNQYGLNGGGPAIRNKTFVFLAWEEFIQRTAAPTPFTVPTAAERVGDFSNLRTAAGALIPIYDPATTCTTCPAGQQRTPFPSNMIPVNRFDKTAAILQKNWPLPNTAGAPFTNTTNFNVNNPAPIDRNWETIRIDQNVSSKQRIFGSFNRWNNFQQGVDPYGRGITSDLHQFADEGMLADTFTFSASTVLDFRMGYTHHEYGRIPTTLGMDLTTIGWPASYNAQLLAPTLPSISPNGFSTSYGSNPTNGSQTGSVSRQAAGVGYIAGSLTKIIGRHTIKFGGEYEWLPTTYGASSGATFSFTSNFTAVNPLSPGNTGNAYASYLLGLGSSGSVGNSHVPAGDQRAGALYVGDTFKVSQRLTLNLGVRWEYTGYWSERHGLETVFLPGATNPVLSGAGLNYLGDVVLVSSDRYKYSTQLIPHWDLFSPRFGAAYHMNEKTVARLGFGTSYVPGTPMQYLEPYTSPVNTAITPWVPTQNSGLTPVSTLNNPFPNGIAPVPGRNPVYESSALGQSIVDPVPGDATPYIMNWNLGFQRQLSNTDLIEVTYVGTRALHQRMGGDTGPSDGGPNLNQIPTQYLSLGSQLLTPVANPFYGLVASGTLAQPTVPRGQLLLPYPQYTGVYVPSIAGFSDSFHSLQAKFQKRFQSGGNLLVSYAWSKNTGNGESIDGHTEVAPPGITQDYYNWSAEHSLLSYDSPHLLVISYVADLPIGKGKRFLSSVSGVTDKLISGWVMSGVTSFQSGFPVALTAQPTSLNTNFGGGTPRPNVIAGCNKIPDGSSQSKITQWFNTSCFSAPNTFGFGSEARTDPNIRAAGIANYDLTLYKNTHVTERISLQFRVEAFNLFNRVQFGPPGTTLGTPTFGVITTQTNNPRLLQLGMRLTF